MTDDPSIYRATVLGSPGPARINTRMIPVVRGRTATGKPSARMILSDEYRSWQSSAARAMVASTTFVGDVDVSIRAFWPSKNKIGPGAGTARGDVDAIIKAVLDALAHAQIIEDDSQVVMVVATKAVDKARPRVEISVRQHRTPKPR